jgi:hypothetical protein
MFTEERSNLITHYTISGMAGYFYAFIISPQMNLPYILGFLFSPAVLWTIPFFYRFWNDKGSRFIEEIILGLFCIFAPVISIIYPIIFTAKKQTK